MNNTIIEYELKLIEVEKLISKTLDEKVKYEYNSILKKIKKEMEKELKIAYSKKNAQDNALKIYIDGIKKMQELKVLINADKNTELLKLKEKLNNKTSNYKKSKKNLYNRILSIILSMTIFISGGIGIKKLLKNLYSTPCYEIETETYSEFDKTKRIEKDIIPVNKYITDKTTIYEYKNNENTNIYDVSNIEYNNIEDYIDYIINKYNKNPDYFYNNTYYEVIKTYTNTDETKNIIYGKTMQKTYNLILISSLIMYYILGIPLTICGSKIGGKPGATLNEILDDLNISKEEYKNILYLYKRKLEELNKQEELNIKKLKNV